LDAATDRAERYRRECEAEDAWLSQAEAEQTAKRLWASRGARYERCTLNNFNIETPDQGPVVSSLRFYADEMHNRVNRGQNIVLLGPSGTGKDHLLAGMVHCAIAARLAVEWQTSADLWIDLREAIKEDRERAVVRILLRPTVLVLSDPVPPHVQATDYQRSILYAIVEKRYSNGKPIWVSINAANRQDAEARIGTAIIDRLRDGALSLACNWPSYRKALEVGK
jgi:DNA replication protein DnaC